MSHWTSYLTSVVRCIYIARRQILKWDSSYIFLDRHSPQTTDGNRIGFLDPLTLTDNHCRLTARVPAT